MPENDHPSKKSTPKGCMGCGAIVALIISLFLLKACISDSCRNSELESSKDPSKIAYLHLDYISEGAKSSVQVSNNEIRVDYRLDAWGLTSSLARSQFLDTSIQIFKAYFSRLPHINRVIIVATLEFIDIKGNKSRDKAIEIVFTRESAKDIQWDNINKNDLPQLASAFWQHPSFY
jgi:hypothetical protein